MIQEQEDLFQQTPNEHFENLMNEIQRLYNGTLSRQETFEAAQNLVGFCKTLIAIHARQNRS
jgi:hypothetical protein